MVEDIITVLVIMPALAIKAGADAGTGIWVTAGIAVLARALSFQWRRAGRSRASAVCYDEVEAATALAVVLCTHLKAGGATKSKPASG